MYVAAQVLGGPGERKSGDRSAHPKVETKRGNEGERILYAKKYAERGKAYGILFIFSLCCECSKLDYVHSHVIHRVNQAEYASFCATGIREYLFNT